MMRPQPFSTMSATTCLVTLNMLFRLVSITASQSSRVIFRNMRSRVMPALLTSTSIGAVLGLGLGEGLDGGIPVATLPTEA
jgi:hypothetical protein